MSLHDKIMALPCHCPPDFLSTNNWQAYKEAHKVARHAAAELALSADAEIERLRDSLSEIAAIELQGSDWNQIDHAKRALKIAREALKGIE